MLHAAQTHGREQGAGRRATHPASTAREAPASRCSAPPQPLRPSDRSSCQHDGRCAYKKQKNTEHEPTDIDIYIGCAKQKSVRRWREVPAGVGRVEVRSGEMCVRALSVGGRARAHAPACESAPTCVSLRASARPVRQSAKREGGARGLAQERPGERGVPACSDRRGTAAGTRTRARSKIKRTRRACVWAACSPPREQKSCGAGSL